MQESIDLFSTAYIDVGLSISTNAGPYTEPTITIGGQKLAGADNFTYIGSTLMGAVTINKEATYRIAQASMAFSRLHASVWEWRGISLQPQLKVCHTIILSS